MAVSVDQSGPIAVVAIIAVIAFASFSILPLKVPWLLLVVLPSWLGKEVRRCKEISKMGLFQFLLIVHKDLMKSKGLEIIPVVHRKELGLPKVLTVSQVESHNCLSSFLKTGGTGR